MPGIVSSRTHLSPWSRLMAHKIPLTEAMLMFTYLLVCALFVRFLEKPGALSACLLAAALVYLYTIHMRCIGTVAAGALTLFIWLVKTHQDIHQCSLAGAIFPYKRQHFAFPYADGDII